MNNEIPYDIITKQLNHSASQQELDNIREWVETSNKNKESYKQIIKMWKVQKALNYKPNKEKAWIKIEEQLNLNQKIIKRPFRYVYHIAALILVALGFGLLFKTTSFFSSKEMITIATMDYQKKIILQDGTEVFLNRNTEIKYPKQFDDNIRLVSLNGEAFFKVKRDPDHPFIIETKNSKTQVLGTSFNLRAIKDELANEVTVTTGKVAFSSLDERQKVILLKGETGHLQINTKEIKKSNAHDPNYKAWLDKVFVFDNQRLEHIIQTINHAYGVNIIITNDDLKRESLSTSFSDLKIEEVLLVITNTIGCEYQIKGESITID